MQPESNTGQNRIVQLDALRGIAVIGIAWMNVHAFALPLQAYYNPTAWGMEGPVDRWVWLVSFVFVEDKFRTLFAMLFGAGCLILLEKDAERGAFQRWRAHYARMVVLFAIGFAHAALLANNDILRSYALAGLVMPLLAGLSAPALYAVSIGLVALHVGAGTVALGAGVLDYYTGRLGSDAVLFANRNFGNDPGAIQYALNLGNEEFAQRLARRTTGFASQLTFLAASVPINLAAMALGMALWRDRMLAGEWRTFRLQRLAAICALIAIPALFAIAWWIADAGFPGALVGPAAWVVSAPFDTLLGFAYALLAMAFLTSSGVLTRLIAAAGRLSLSNYLATSLIFAGIFASWGLDLFGEVSRSQALAISFIPIAAMLIWSPLWTKRLGQGPMERIWRGLTGLLS